MSVIVPVRNEASNLERCLPALEWADEVFVVDSQSTDDDGGRWLRSMGAEVVQFRFNGTLSQEEELGA